MNNEPLVSVIVPVYNASTNLAQCVNSLMEQRYRNLDIILVDDGSTDGSSSMCDQYVEHDARIRTIHQKNSGVAAARNAGLSASRGAYVTFVDSDDWLKPEALAVAMRSCVDHDLDMFVMGHERVVESVTARNADHTIRIVPKASEVKRLMDIEVPQSTHTINELCKMDQAGLLFSCWGKVFRRDRALAVKFRNGVSYGEDSIYVLDFLKQGGKVMFAAECLYEYREQQLGLVRGFHAGKARDIEFLHKHILEFFNPDILNDDNRQALYTRMANDILWAINAVRSASAEVSLKERTQYVQDLADTPYRKRCLRGVRAAGASRIMKILFAINSGVLWNLYLMKNCK